VAKGKPAKPTKTQSAASGKGKTPPKMARTNTEKKPVAVTPAFTGIAIGHAAGDVWELLRGGDPKTIVEIKKSVKAPGDIVVAAIGWLAREDKLAFTTSGRVVKISLS
jgi:Winged helix-turn-helix domain (DUF2582)